MMVELKPCPFCGGEAERLELTDEENFGGSVICCKKCGASSPVHFDRKENLDDSWNRRTLATPKPVARHIGTIAHIDHGKTSLAAQVARLANPSPSITEAEVEAAARAVLQKKFPATRPEDMWLDPVVVGEVRIALTAFLKARRQG